MSLVGGARRLPSSDELLDGVARPCDRAAEDRRGPSRCGVAGGASSIGMGKCAGNPGLEEGSESAGPRTREHREEDGGKRKANSEVRTRARAAGAWGLRQIRSRRHQPRLGASSRCSFYREEHTSNHARVKGDREGTRLTPRKMVSITETLRV